MGFIKFGQKIVAPAVDTTDPNAGVGLLPQGTNGQLLIGQTSADTAYKTVSGDITLTNLGVTAIGSKRVTAAKAAVFTSVQLTGTGSTQNVAHGLAVVPSVIMVVPTDGGTVLYGTHTTTNVVVTVTSAKKFDVFAWA